MTDELKEQEKLSKKEEAAYVRKDQIMINYTDDEGVQRKDVEILGNDGKNYFMHNPDNDKLLIDACNNSGLDIELKAYSDVFIIDAWYKKQKEFVCQIKKVGGKDLTNPLLIDKRLVLTINGDSFYSMSEARRKYHILKEVSRILYNYEKDQYKILKYNYQNNRVIMDKFGPNPKEEDLKEL